jgi:anthranilate/para-aminobenzoate synthase component II
LNICFQTGQRVRRYAEGDNILQGLASPFQAARYHSLVISRDGFPEDELEVTAWTEDETIMGRAVCSLARRPLASPVRVNQ